MIYLIEHKNEDQMYCIYLSKEVKSIISDFDFNKGKNHSYIFVLKNGEEIEAKKFVKVENSYEIEIFLNKWRNL